MHKQMKITLSITTAVLFLGTALSAQVGVNTETPKTTMDVTAKRNSSGVITDNNQLIGLQAPRLTLAELTDNTAVYGTDQKGALVYITDISGGTAVGQRININVIGYYYFDGALWQKVTGSGSSADINIYKDDGLLTDNRTVGLNGKTLTFQGSEGYTRIDTGGSFAKIQSETADRAQLRLSTQDQDSDGVISNFDIDLFSDNYLQMFATGEMNGISFGTHVAQNSSPIEFLTSPGGFALGEARMKITGEGNIGINASAPTNKLHVIATADPIRLEGLQAGSNTDKLVVADGTGILKTIDASALASSPINIYTTNGTLTSTRTLAQNGFPLMFSNGTTGQSTTFNNTNGSGIEQRPGSSGRANLRFYDSSNAMSFTLYSDNNNASQMYSVGSSTSMIVGTHQSNAASPLVFTTSIGGGAAGTEKMRITPIGNIGINQNTPTERLDNNGITRLRVLPLNGATNAIFTNPSGLTASATQNQTFTATRTVVADANGVLGYINGLGAETTSGSSKVIVSTSVPGTQNINGNNPVTGIFSVENIDLLNAWTSDVFTVPAASNGIYAVNMQNSNIHTVPDASNWFNMAYYEKSTDNGSSWSVIMRDTRANNGISDINNGNALMWTGTLNAGDKIRVRFHCNSSNNNIVELGTLIITRIYQ